MKTEKKEVGKQLNEQITQNRVETDQIKKEVQKKDDRAVFRRRKKYWMWVKNK